MVCPQSLKILLKNVENLSVRLIQSCLSFKYNNARKQKHPIPLQFVINITILVTVLKLWWIAGSPQRKGKKKKHMENPHNRYAFTLRATYSNSNRLQHLFVPVQVRGRSVSCYGLVRFLQQQAEELRSIK